MSRIPLDEVCQIRDILTHDPDTGAVTDADSAPTFDVFEEATDTPILDDQVMTKRTSLTGNYRGAFTVSAANGFELGKWYNVVVTATVAGVTAKCSGGWFMCVAAEQTAGYVVSTLKVGTGTGEINLSSGKVPATIAAGDIAASAITASAIATGAIDADALAADTITAAKIATGALTAATFAANAIDAAALAADAVAEIQSGLATLASIAALNNISAAQVNAEVLDVLNVDTFAQPTGAPAATATLVAMIGRLHQVLRNKLTITASTKTLFDDSGSALWTKSLTDDGTVFTENEGA